MTGSRITRPKPHATANFSGTRTMVVQRCSCGQAARDGGECDECQRRVMGGEHSAGATRASHSDFSRVPARSGLKIGSPDDAYEREADMVADEVMQMGPVVAGERGVDRTEVTLPRIQRASPERRDEQPSVMRKGLHGASCESTPGGEEQAEEEEEPQGNGAVRAKSQGGRLGRPDRALEGSLASSRGGGTPLAPATRSFMEQRFGEDLSAVRVHTDQRASAMNQQLNAAAFTSGCDIYFRSGRYDPVSFEGNRLLAHELTHVIQQRSSIPGVASTGSDRAPIQHYIQRFRLNGFPTTEATAMKAAIPAAVAKVKSCSKLSWYGKRDIPIALNNSRYDYIPDLGLCGWTFPTSWYIEVGKSAFDPSVCCDLASTLAHEAAHTVFYTEGRARKMECNCFGCSC